MAADRPPQLILTGGTISSTSDTKGFLAPSDEISGPIEQAGMDARTAKRPFAAIDSINFNIHEHYPLLRDAALAALSRGSTPIICGGTDTLAWYSSLLTRDLMRMGRLTPGKGESVIFLSSMISLEDGREHVVNVLKAGKEAAALGLNGGFAICAEDCAADRFIVHDVTHNFDKVSGELTNAFRSACAAGHLYLNGGHASYDPAGAYQPTPPLSHSHSTRLSRIAPPLMQLNDPLPYVRWISRAEPPFDGIIIEGPPPENSPEFISACRSLIQSGTRVIFCNPMRFYGTNNITIKPATDSPYWKRLQEVNRTFRALSEADAEFVTALPKDAWIEATLDSPREHFPVNIPIPEKEREKKHAFNLRYVPHLPVMEQTIDTLAPHASRMHFSALTLGAMPDILKETMKKYTDTLFESSFEYAGHERIGEEGRPFPEGSNAHRYQAGAGMAAFLSNQTARNNPRYR